jgi:hypothetical protein
MIGTQKFVSSQGYLDGTQGISGGNMDGQVKG